MSDMRMFPIHSVLRMHTVNIIAFQWDGSKDQAMTITEELTRELPMRSAALVGARYHADTWSSPRFVIGVMRTEDEREWEFSLWKGAWLALWLHEGRVQLVETLSATDGEERFMPVRPVISLAARRKELE